MSTDKTAHHPQGSSGTPLDEKDDVEYFVRNMGSRTRRHARSWNATAAEPRPPKRTPPAIGRSAAEGRGRCKSSREHCRQGPVRWCGETRALNDHEKGAEHSPYGSPSCARR